MKLKIEAGIINERRILMPKYRISYSFENIVEADDIDEARQFLIDDVIFDMKHGQDAIDVEEIEEEEEE
jgi:hypothetical protein